jgi:hypothetical protein
MNFTSNPETVSDDRLMSAKRIILPQEQVGFFLSIADYRPIKVYVP